jgi:dienelactone hydrolase
LFDLPEYPLQTVLRMFTDSRLHFLHRRLRHGFAVPDVPVFDPTAAEQHWAASFTLFRDTLAPA